ncbi:4984_t:CDS:2 [Acaulospora morrowiae]|uniref:4984_t:CDS:1 n=1 Tax=Acaulospora morrowiae TaxID=94023 RepID=A0A9N9CLK4_9GLOM|nr:4984_t:CDS:2 [Acaulospora morrowiae]
MSTSHLSLPNLTKLIFAGNLFTFAQFLFISGEGLFHHLEYRPPSPILRLKKRTVPVYRWVVQVVLFFTVSVLNNIALGYRISVPLHIIFRSGGLIISMVLGWALAGKRYTLKQVISVVMVTLGVVLATISSGSINTKGRVIDVSTSDYVIGIILLSIALILSGIMGLYQEFTYQKYGSNWRESLFYTHFLALPLFCIFYSDIAGQIQSFNNSRLISLDIVINKVPGDFHVLDQARSVLTNCSLPQTWLYLIMNVLTQMLISEAEVRNDANPPGNILAPGGERSRLAIECPEGIPEVSEL